MNGGLNLPPFPSWERDELNPNEAPKEHYAPEEAAGVKEALFTQLDGFDACLPHRYMSVTPHGLCPAALSRSNVSWISARCLGKTTQHLGNIVAH